MTPLAETTKRFDHADLAWGEELRRIFGKEASEARYDERGTGEPGSRLRELHDARMVTYHEWCAACDASRAA